MAQFQNRGSKGFKVYHDTEVVPRGWCPKCSPTTGKLVEVWAYGEDDLIIYCSTCGEQARDKNPTDVLKKAAKHVYGGADAKTPEAKRRAQEIAFLPLPTIVLGTDEGAS